MFWKFLVSKRLIFSRLQSVKSATFNLLKTVIFMCIQFTDMVFTVPCFQEGRGNKYSLIP